MDQTLHEIYVGNMGKVLSTISLKKQSLHFSNIAI